MDKYLVGGFNHLEKYEFVNGWWIIPYIMENKIHVPNHQPDTHRFDSVASRMLAWPLWLRLSRNGNSIRPHFKRCTVKAIY